MAFVAGVYTLPAAPALPAVAGNPIVASYYNAVQADYAAAFNLTFLRDGTANPTANLPMAGFRVTGAGVATANTDLATLLQTYAPVASYTFADTPVTLTVASQVAIVNGAGGNIGMTLPSAATFTAAATRILVILRTDAVDTNSLTLSAAATDNVNGGASVNVPAKGCVVLVSNGVHAWRVVGDLQDKGSFTLGAAATSVIPNLSITANSKVFLSPTNADAATLMASAKSLYTSSLSAGVSFTVATANAAAAAGTETFDYRIIG